MIMIMTLAKVTIDIPIIQIGNDYPFVALMGVLALFVIVQLIQLILRFIDWLPLT